MEIYKLLIKTNIKKHKSAFITFFIFSIIAAWMIYISFQMTEGLRNLYFNKIDETNSADCSYILPKSFVGKYDSEIEKIINNHASEEKREDALLYKNLKISGSEINPFTGAFVIEKNEVDKLDNNIYIPYVCKTFFGINESSSIVLEESDFCEEYKVQGLREDVLWGSRGNISFSLSTKAFDNLYKTAIDKNKAVKIDVYGVDDITSINDELSEFVGSHIDDVEFFNLSDINFSYNVRVGNTNIYSAILLLGGVFCILIACILAVFNIKNTIEEDKKNIGVLTAVGYRGKTIIGIYLMEFILTGVMGLLLGIVLAYICTPGIMDLIATDIGFIWKNSLLIISVIKLIAIYIGLIIIVVYLSSKALNKLSPVDTLSDVGVVSSNFKSKLSIEKMPLNINMGIVIKKIVYEKVKSILTCGALFVIIFIAGLAVIIYSKIVVDKQGIISITGAELYDIDIILNDKEDYEVINKTLKGDSDIKKTVLAVEPGSLSVICDEDINAKVTLYDDYTKLDYPSIYEGRYPQYSNEIAVSANVAKALNKKIGETISVKNIFDEEVKTDNYLIVGFSQGTYTGGLDAYFTYEGISKIWKNPEWNGIHIYLKDPKEVDKKIEEYSSVYGDKATYIGDFKRTFEMQLSSIKDSVKLVAILVVFVASMLVVIMGYLVSSSLIASRRREFGIMKAIGYTNFQLSQTITYTFITFIVVSGIVASICLKLGSNIVIGNLFHGMGVHKLDFSFPLLWIVVLMVILVIIGVLVSMIFSYKIKSIRPCTLIK